MRNLFGTCAFVALAACVSTVAYAQDTTSAVRGVITDGGSPVAGAQVLVIHTPSGTTSTSTSDADGNFAVSGLRAGGPFTVQVNIAGRAPYEVTDLQLTAGQPLRLPVEVAASVEELVVSGLRREQSTGPITAFSRDDISTIASISRDVRDIAKRDPFVTIDPGTKAISIAGQNGRLNRFSIDGLKFSDNVGLNNGALPTQRGPVPLDAIEQLSVKLAPFDISEGDFQGGSVNLVLRSGNSNFTGSAFGTYTSDNLTGDKTRGTDVKLDFTSENYGAFVSGPIFKDKLFFALSYEHLAETQPNLIGLAGAPNVVPNISQTQIDTISGISQSRYNYATLGVPVSLPEEDEKYTAKLDWNINNMHRASFSYIYNENGILSAATASVSPVSPALSLESSYYTLTEEVSSGVFQLNSDWSENFHSEVRGYYRKKDRLQPTQGARTIGQYQVCLDPSATLQQNGAANLNPTSCSQGSTAAPGAGRLFFGVDVGRQQTEIHTKDYGTDITLRLDRGDHAMKVNASWNRIDVFNAFVPNALGTYYFDSVGDYQAGRAGSLVLTGSTTGVISDIFAQYAYDKYNLGVQDSWDVTPTLNLTYGLRSDFYKMSDVPPTNLNFLARYGFDNTENYNGKSELQPRFGVTWRASDRLTVRGGGGLFVGGTPDIVISNSFSVPGVFNNSITIQRTGAGCNVAADLCSAALDNVAGGAFSPTVINYLQTNVGAIANSNVNAIAKDYKLQSSWKTSLSADYDATLPYVGDWHFGGDLLLSWVKNAPNFIDLRSAPVGVAPDGRTRYSTATGANSDYLLTNTKEGSSKIFVARFEKRLPTLDMTVSGSYTWQDVDDFSSVEGTTSQSFNSGQAALDPNNGALGTSIYEVKNSFRLNVDYAHEFFEGYATRFNLYGELRSGSPYSLTMNDPTLINGRSSVFGVAGGANRFLLYVPILTSQTADPRVIYDSTATYTALQAFAKTAGLTEGAIVAKNNMKSPDFFKVDLHVDQELPVPLVNGAKFKLFADVENLLNLLNNDWGSYRRVNALSPVVNVSCVAAGANACAQYRYSSYQTPAIVNQAKTSLWAVRIGARIEY